jgi:hypothetical protein
MSRLGENLHGAGGFPLTCGGGSLKMRAGMCFKPLDGLPAATGYPAVAQNSRLGPAVVGLMFFDPSSVYTPSLQYRIRQAFSLM